MRMPDSLDRQPVPTVVLYLLIPNNPVATAFGYLTDVNLDPLRMSPAPGTGVT